MGALNRTDKVLCAVYGVLGVIGLVGTQVVLIDYIINGDGSLLDDVVANGAATFSLIDLLTVAIVAVVFIVVEGRRLGMRFVWVYVVLTFAIAICVALPAFLIARQIHLARQRQDVSTSSTS